MKKDTIKTLAKTVLGLVLVAYVLRSKMIDFEALRGLLHDPKNIVVALALNFFCAFCVTTRWFLLARAQELSISYKSTFEMTMIGNFFNTFMPGSVGGDVVKAWYVAGEAPKKKTRAVFTVLIDRAIGLSIYFLYSATTLLFYTSWLAGKPKLQMLAMGVWGFSLSTLVFAFLFYTPFLWKFVAPKRILASVERWPFVHRVIEAALLYRHHVKTMGMAVALSALSILASTTLYKWFGEALGVPMDLAHYMFIIPIAQTVSAIPLLPGGLGVGQVAFSNLFLLTGIATPEQGGTLCTAFQIYTIVFNCLGAFFYLRFRRKPQAAGSPAVGTAVAVSRPLTEKAASFSTI